MSDIRIVIAFIKCLALWVTFVYAYPYLRHAPTSIFLWWITVTVVLTITIIDIKLFERSQRGPRGYTGRQGEHG